MMPAHYAITDAAIVVVAAWAAMALWRSNKPLPAFAMACFAIPAAIGAIRLGGGLQAELAALHMGSAQLLGLAGAFMLTATCLGRVIRMDVRIIAIASLLIAAAVFFLGQALLPAFFLVALVAALGVALRDTIRRRASKLVPAGLTILLANALLIRGAAWLSDAAAWHVYHVLIALALALVAKGLLGQRR